MRLFCNHKWEKVTSTYCPPPVTHSTVRYFSLDELTKFLNGKTTILFKCSKCQKTKVIEMVGKEAE